MGPSLSRKRERAIVVILVGRKSLFEVVGAALVYAGAEQWVR
jgi:hypothetical protein